MLTSVHKIPLCYHQNFVKIPLTIFLGPIEIPGKEFFDEFTGHIKNMLKTWIFTVEIQYHNKISSPGFEINWKILSLPISLEYSSVSRILTSAMGFRRGRRMGRINNLRNSFLKLKNFLTIKVIFTNHFNIAKTFKNSMIVNNLNMHLIALLKKTYFF